MSTTIAPNTPRRVAGVLLRLLGRAVMLTVLAAVIGAIVVLMVLPRATQGSALTVLTGSMTPEIPVGSVVFIRPVDPATLEVGDVATYQKKPGVESYVTHRIVAIDTSTTPTSFTFKGDANRGEDIDPIPATAVRGEVWFHVPYLGAVRDALNGKAGLSLLAMIVLGGYAISQVWGAIQDRRRQRGEDPAAPPSTDDILCDRPLVVVELGTDQGDPEAVAHGLNGVVLTRTAETFTVLIAPPAASSAAAVMELELLEPVSLRLLHGEDWSLVLQPSRSPASPRSSSKRGSHARA